MPPRRIPASRTKRFPFFEQLRIAFRNRAFLYVVGIYLFAWLALQITASIIPFYATFWMGLDSYFLPALLVQGTAIIMMWPCNLLSRKLGKQGVFYVGIGVWLIVQIGLFFLQPGQFGLLYALCVAASFGVATAYVVPWAMLPDVIELDELRTGKRREGIFYAFMTLLQKFGLAGGLFLVGVFLEAANFLAESDIRIVARRFILGASLEGTGFSPAQAIQPDTALWAIRAFMGLVPLTLLCCALVLCYFYPISRAVHAEIMLQLAARREADGRRSAG